MCFFFFFSPTLQRLTFIIMMRTDTCISLCIYLNITHKRMCTTKSADRRQNPQASRPDDRDLFRPPPPPPQYVFDTARTRTCIYRTIKRRAHIRMAFSARTVRLLFYPYTRNIRRASARHTAVGYVIGIIITS